MKKLCKWFGGIAVVGMMLFQTAPVSAADGLPYVKAEYQAMSKINSLVIKGNGSLFCPLAKVTSTMDGDFILHPYVQAKGTLHLNAIGIAGNPIVRDVPFYIDSTNNQVIMYVKDSVKGWEKTTVPVKDLSSNMMMTPEKIEQGLSLIKSAEVLKETDTSRVLQITVDGQKIGDIMKKQSTTVKKSPQSEQLNKLVDAMSQDISYIETINKQTNLPESQSIDLSQWTRTMVGTALKAFATNKQANPDQEEVLNTFLNNSTLKENLTYGPFNEVKTISIPAEVISAPEMRSQKQPRKLIKPRQLPKRDTNQKTSQRF